MSADLIFPKAAFRRLCREISTDCKPDMRWQASALEALQVAGEQTLVTLFECKVTNFGNGLNANDDRWYFSDAPSKTRYT
jgi:hypothetical protein